MITYQQASGTTQLTNGAPSIEIVPAVAGRTIFLMRAHIGVTTAAVGGGGLVELRNGSSGTAFVQAYADAVGTHVINFGEEGYPLTSATSLYAVAASAVTTQATARVTVVCKVV